MCGISGIAFLERKNISIKEAIYSMSRSIAHRGPDDEGFVLFNQEQQTVLGSSHSSKEVFGNSISYCPASNIESFSDEGYYLAFAHRRLSILDLSPSGHQPMCNQEQQLWITFNGEIYNYIEIRNELIALGRTFNTQSDTEVVLAAYQQWGGECVKKFNGMWAFVIFDKIKNQLFASRDRFGVKPFYFYFKDHMFCFASEQKAIQQLPFVASSINQKAVFDFFAYTEQEYQETGFFSNIIELFPSHNLVLDLSSKELRKEQYYSLPMNPYYEDFSEEKYTQHIEQTRALFNDSIKLRLRSDVPVGCCLSGGIDSSAIAGAMNHAQNNQAIHLFSAIFPNESIDESKWAKQVVDSTHSKWHTITPNGNQLMEELQDLVYCQDIPLWSTSTYAQFKVMQLVKENGIKVVLDGQGGDELFAGYTPYYVDFWNELSTNKSGAAVIQHIRKKGSFTSGVGYWMKENIKRKDGLLAAMLRQFKPGPTSYLKKEFNKAYNTLHHTKTSHSLNEALHYEFVNTRLKLYLKCEDRCGMWHSVESRTPFADDLPLIENTFAIEGIYKLHNGVSKSLLREAVKGFIPKGIYERKDKMGYLTPNNRWLAEHPKKVKELLSKDLDSYLDVKKLHQTIDGLSSAPHEQTIVFKALTFSVWKDRFKM